MTRKAIVKPKDLGKYFKGIDLKGRLSVIESAKTLLEVQNEDSDLLAVAPVPVSPNESGKGQG